MEITGETGGTRHPDVPAGRHPGTGAVPRHLPLPGTFNLRDLGGYPAGDGGTVRWRTLLRSDALHWLTDDGRAALRELGLRTVIDLRTQAETEIAPSALGSVGARTLHISVLDGDLRKLPVRLDSIYQFIVDERGAAIGHAVGQLCAPGALPALIHCAAGKDRTGIVVALVLACAGVPDDIIAADYALSGSYLNPGSTAAIGQVKASSGLQDQLTDSLLGSPPELILQVLDRVRRRWGGAGDYLIGHGLQHGDLVALRARLIEYPARSYPPAGAGGAASPA